MLTLLQKRSTYRLSLLRLFTLFLLSPLLVQASALSKDNDKRFDAETDLLLAHFDSKTDVDDIHSIAAFATLISNDQFSHINYHAVAGAYGIQEGLYVPANELFKLAFDSHWSDAHNDFDRALDEVTNLVATSIHAGGAVWIAECGQSDFSAAMVKKLKSSYPNIDTKYSIHIIQHSNWNQDVTTPEKLQYVKENTDYKKIPDGNATGNGTPGFNTSDSIDWKDSVKDPKLVSIWETAIAIGNKYNGQEGRYLNKNISIGGLDFSDISEVAWILNQEQIVDAEEFFKTFGK